MADFMVRFQNLIWAPPAHTRAFGRAFAVGRWHTRRMKHLFAILLMAAAGFARAADNDGFVSLFNGRDLTGWVNANCAPET